MGLRTFVVGGTCPLLYVSSFFCVKRKAVQDKSQCPQVCVFAVVRAVLAVV